MRASNVFATFDLPFPQVTRERAERKEMEEAFKRQASKVDEVLQ